ncbi:hypothetical protein Mapa_016078 [Marchantia paleacea]|nr:hypothetical protein Mapa_016078 [Marchantia paleacea]
MPLHVLSLAQSSSSFFVSPPEPIQVLSFFLCSLGGWADVGSCHKTCRIPQALSRDYHCADARESSACIVVVPPNTTGMYDSLALQCPLSKLHSYGILVPHFQPVS